MAKFLGQTRIVGSRTRAPEFHLNFLARFPIQASHGTWVFLRTIPLHHFPLTRLLLNLCLVVVMAIQPVAFATAQGSCGDTQSDCKEFKCSSCQCCDVLGEQELCGCCGGASDSDACCGGSQHQVESQSDEPVVDPTFGEISPVVPVANRQYHSSIAEVGHVQVTGCRCGVRSEPAAPAPVRIPVEELRETVLIAFLSDSDLAGQSIVGAPRSCLGSGIGSLAPHFSQRNLCVWRL